LKPKHDVQLSHAAFNFNSRRYSLVPPQYQYTWGGGGKKLDWAWLRAVLVRAMAKVRPYICECCLPRHRNAFCILKFSFFLC
jgi:hypothetical protein